MADDARLHVEVVSPEHVLYSGDGEMVVCRTAEGDIAFLPGHAPFLGALGVAKVRVVLPDGEQAIAVHAGFVEVSTNRVVVLSDVAEIPGQIDVERARAAKARAEAALAADETDAEAADALQRAELRLDLVGAGSTT